MVASLPTPACIRVSLPPPVGALGNFTSTVTVIRAMMYMRTEEVAKHCRAYSVVVCTVTVKTSSQHEAIHPDGFKIPSQNMAP